uniref:Beta-2-glycoprotein 1 n=1 Tax=Leptobrachium leishanense TaxID=445787 RepID=A0A8C5R7I0_9ANUR
MQPPHKHTFRNLLHCITPSPRELPFATYQPLKILYEFRDTVTYSCSPGYVKKSGTVKAVCLFAGNWDHASLTCEPLRCPLPGTLINGKLFKLKDPVCLPAISCPPPPVPKFGALVHYTPKVGNISLYLDNVTYGCLPKYALFGNETASCTENKTWSHMPECRNVQCKRPTEIDSGFMTYSPQRLYDYQETVTYGCKPSYVLDGPKTSICDKNGHWTLKPTCRAPCFVTTKKATVLLNGRKTRVEDIADQLIQHGDIITYFCKDEKEKCSHNVESRCQDGHFAIPSCYKGWALPLVWTTRPPDKPCFPGLIYFYKLRST